MDLPPYKKLDSPFLRAICHTPIQVPGRHRDQIPQACLYYHLLLTLSCERTSTRALVVLTQLKYQLLTPTYVSIFGTPMIDHSESSPS